MRLLRSWELAYLVGILTERLFGKNLYIRTLDTWRQDPLVERKIDGRRMLLDLRDRGLSRHLFIDGIHERQSMEAFKAALRSLREPITVIDVGANIGYFTLLEASIVGSDGAVYAFEPNPSARNTLGRNIALNGVDGRVTIVPLAVSDEIGTREFCISHHSNWSRLTSGLEADCDRVIETPVVRLDSFLAEQGIEPASVRAVRMDVEGHEHAILSGMESVLAATSEFVLFIELHPELLEASYHRILDMIETSNFVINHVSRDWAELDIESFDELRRIDGSHVRVIFTRLGDDQL
jgi:FkbM family methyltransferase